MRLKFSMFDVTSSSSFKLESKFSDCDLIWNHLDLLHRPHVHNTYTESKVLERSNNKQITETKINFVVPFKVKVREEIIGLGQFRQFIELNKLFKIVINITINQGTICVDWSNTSSIFLLPLHFLVHFKMILLNRDQNEEDMEIRRRRKTLRDLGFTFIPDGLDFVSANSWEHYLVPPSDPNTYELNLSNIQQDIYTDVKIGPYDFHLFISSDKLTIWSRICPHQGAELKGKPDCNNMLTCHWHGLKFEPVYLQKSQPRKNLHFFMFEYLPEKNILQLKLPTQDT